MLNFGPYHLSRKLRFLHGYISVNIDLLSKLMKKRKIKESKLKNWNEASVAQLILQIVEKWPDEIENFTAIKQMIDHQFVNTQKFFLWQAIFYFMFFIIPFTAQFFISGKQNKTIIDILCFGSLVSASFIYLYNSSALMAFDMKKFFNNKFSLAPYFLYMIMVYYQILRSNFPNLDIIEVNNKEQTGIIVTLQIMGFFIILFAILQLMYYLQINRRLGIFVELLF